MNRFFLAPILTRLAMFLLLIAAVGALFATPALAWMQLKGSIGSAGYVVSAVFAAIACGIAFLLRERIISATAQVVRVVSIPSTRTWLAFVIALGLLLRIVWIVSFPVEPISDGASYLALAQSLLAGQPYGTVGIQAYYPPGYPFFLIPWIALPITSKLAFLVSNLALYAASAILIFRFGRFVGGEATGRLASLLIALWPACIANCSLPEKENLLIFMLPLVLYLYVTSVEGQNRAKLRVFTAGLLLGFATLAQPSLQLFFTVFLCFDLMRRAAFGLIAQRIALVILGMVLVIAPWTARNMAVLKAPILISTNGGDNFYRANNPLATGAFTFTGTVDLRNYSELDKNREGFRLARQWIISHPTAFLLLALKKDIHFLGDDSTGIYGTLKRAAGGSERTYIIAKGAANGLWCAFWMMVLVFFGWTKTRKVDNPFIPTLSFGFCYFFVLHSIFESGGKYHLPAVALLALVISALAVDRIIRKNTTLSYANRPFANVMSV